MRVRSYVTERPVEEVGRRAILISFNAMAEQELVAEGQTPSSSPLDESPDRRRDEADVDEAIEESFPASDPLAWTGESGIGGPADRSS